MSAGRRLTRKSEEIAPARLGGASYILWAGCRPQVRTLRVIGYSGFADDRVASVADVGWEEPIVKRVWTILLASSWFLLTSAAPAETGLPDTIQLHGFTVEYAESGLEKLQRMQPSLERQMEIVEQSGVPAATLEFFKSVPVVLVARMDKGFGYARRDAAGRQIVELLAAKLPSDRPILLHELLHAYHGVKLGPTPMIRDSYRQAVQSGVYGRYAKAHFLEAPNEYFAVIGSIFLYGKRIDQPPFDCRLTAKYQPQFIDFLTEQFGPHPCK